MFLSLSLRGFSDVSPGSPSSSFQESMNVVKTIFIWLDGFFLFFQEKACFFFTHKFAFFCGSTVHFLFKFSSFPLLKGRRTHLSNSKSVKVTKNVADF